MKITKEEYNNIMIEEYKQKVREAIDMEISFAKRMDSKTPEAEMRLKDLKKELGL